MSPPNVCRAAAALSLLLAAAFGTVPAAPAPLPKREPVARANGDLHGTWRQVFVGYEGSDDTEAAAPERTRWVVTADKITIRMRSVRGAGSWTYRIDPTRSPAQLDLSTPSETLL